MNKITYQDFLDNYHNNKIIVLVDRIKAMRLIESRFANKRFKPAHYFWLYFSVFIILILPIILLFKWWPLSILSVIVGWQIYQACKKSAASFVLENMLEDEIFWKFVFANSGAKMMDDGNIEYVPL